MIAYDDMSGVPPTGGGTPLWTAGVCGASAAPRARLMARVGVRPHGPLTPRAGQLIFAALPRQGEPAAMEANSTTTAISKLARMPGRTRPGTSRGSDLDGSLMTARDAPHEAVSFPGNVSTGC